MMEREMACAIVQAGSNGVHFVGISNRVYFAATIAPLKAVSGYDPVSDIQEVVYEAENL